MDNATDPRVLSMEQLLLLVALYSLPRPSFPIQFEPLEPSLNESSIQLDKFLLLQSMQPVMLSTPPLGLPYLPFEDLPNLKPNGKQQCNNVAMSVEVSVEPDTKGSDFQQSPQKMPFDDAVTLTDQFESKE
jgi:hypothetical protein